MAVANAKQKKNRERKMCVKMGKFFCSTTKTWNHHQTNKRIMTITTTPTTKDEKITQSLFCRPFSQSFATCSIHWPSKNRLNKYFYEKQS